MEEAYKFLIEDVHLSKNNCVVVAVSGGPDSMALLSFLCNIQKQLKIKIICAHVNHNVRKESIEEKEFVENFCKKRRVIFEYMKIDSYGSDNFHNEARNIRYQFFEKMIKKYNASYLLTAHHGDDLIETILMRMVRGTNLKGYSGFSKIIDKDSYKIIRPFIYYTKEDLKNFNQEHGISYVEDSSNEKDVYTRNRFRKHILPFLKEENKNVHKKFLKFSETLNEYNDFVTMITDKKLKKIYTENKINISVFEKEPKIIKIQVINKILEKIYKKNLSCITSKHVDLLINLTKCKKASSRIDLPKNIKAIKSYHYIYFKNETNKEENYILKLKENMILPNGHRIEKIISCEESSNFIFRFLKDDLKFPLFVRTKKIGDKMQIKGMNKEKKISDIFINEKVKLDERNLWPIVTDASGEIIWIPGLKKTKFDKQKGEKYDIILKYY